MNKRGTKHLQKGASLVEYCLLIALISLATMTSVRGLGRQVSNQFVILNNELNNVGRNELGGGTERSAPPPGIGPGLGGLRPGNK